MKSVTIAAGQSLQKWWKSLKSLNSFIMYKIALLWNHKFTTHQSSVKLCIISASVHQCITALCPFTGFVLWTSQGSSNALSKLCSRSKLWTREQCNSKLCTCALVIRKVWGHLWTTNALCKLCARSELWTIEQTSAPANYAPEVDTAPDLRPSPLYQAAS